MQDGAKLEDTEYSHPTHSAGKGNLIVTPEAKKILKHWNSNQFTIADITSVGSNSFISVIIYTLLCVDINLFI